MRHAAPVQLILTGGNGRRRDEWRDGAWTQSLLFSLFFLAPNYLFVPPRLRFCQRGSPDRCVRERLSRKDFPLLVFKISLFLLFFISLSSYPHCVDAKVQFGAAQRQNILLCFTSSSSTAVKAAASTAQRSKCKTSANYSKYKKSLFI